MKRLLIVLVAVGLLVAFAGPVGAVKPDKPPKPTTTTTTWPAADLPACWFNDNSVLEYETETDIAVWNGDDPLWCDWTPEQKIADYRFWIEPTELNGAQTFVGPYLLIKEEHPGADSCFRDWYNGKQTLGVTFPKEGSEPIHLPGDCLAGTNDDDDYTITVYVISKKGGDVQLRMEQLQTNP